MKTCCMCKKDLSLDMFCKHSGRLDGLQTVCKVCEKEYRILNKSKRNAYSRNYAIEYQKLDRVKTQKKVHKKERYANDLNYQISSRIRARLSEAIRCNFQKGIAVDLLGCSISEYKSYLESLFTPDMNWTNYKTLWEIDHIREICTFDLTIETNQYECFHHTNTRPLYKDENRKKILLSVF